MKAFLLAPAALALCAMVQDAPLAMQPGQWEFTTHISEIDIPGTTPEIVRSARAALGPPETKASCVSPEEAANPAARLVSRGGRSNCTFSRTTFADGRIDVAGSCEGNSAAAPVNVELRGAFTPTQINAAITAETVNPTMLLRGTMTGRRTGDCQPEPS